MKIWLQTCGAIGSDPKRGRYRQALARQAKEAARPDTIVEVHGVDKRIPELDRCCASINICQWQMIRNAFRAEREGYDAFAVTCMGSPGFYEIKQAADIPVAYAAESAVHIAQMLAPKFAFFVHNKVFLPQLHQAARRFGLTENMVHGGHVGVEDDEIEENLFQKVPDMIESIMKAGSEIVARGADILIPASMLFSVFLAEHGINEINGARVIDTLGCLIKTAELMVELKNIGMTRSKHGLFEAPPKEALAEIQNIYEAHEFK